MVTLILIVAALIFMSGLVTGEIVKELKGDKDRAVIAIFSIIVTAFTGLAAIIIVKLLQDYA